MVSGRERGEGERGTEKRESLMSGRKEGERRVQDMVGGE